MQAPSLTGDKGPQNRKSDTGNPYYRCKLIIIDMVRDDTKLEWTPTFYWRALHKNYSMVWDTQKVFISKDTMTKMVEKGPQSASAKMYPVRYRYLEKKKNQTVTHRPLQISKISLQIIKKVRQWQLGYFYTYSWNTSQPNTASWHL